MARRYSGAIRIEASFVDMTDSAGRGQYSVAVCCKGFKPWKNTVWVHPIGAYDSPETYDRVCETALVFASDEYGDALSNEACGSYRGEHEPCASIPDTFGYQGDSYIVFRSITKQTACFDAIAEVHMAGGRAWSAWEEYKRTHGLDK